ncbi:hypothetical protein RIR_jg34227.t1 [Rhizophagus irregularis DAOM 181602=DAOM 197198]|nr:hypothetical protein RIR_jg34227.t1 [Rhizophagus irregularis DAOM 181602=DAOM 197198]
MFLETFKSPQYNIFNFNNNLCGNKFMYSMIPESNNTIVQLCLYIENNILVLYDTSTRSIDSISIVIQSTAKNQEGTPTTSSSIYVIPYDHETKRDQERANVLVFR